MQNSIEFSPHFPLHFLVSLQSKKHIALRISPRSITISLALFSTRLGRKEFLRGCLSGISQIGGRSQIVSFVAWPEAGFWTFRQIYTPTQRRNCTSHCLRWRGRRQSGPQICRILGSMYKHLETIGLSAFCCQVFDDAKLKNSSGNFRLLAKLKHIFISFLSFLQ